MIEPTDQDQRLELTGRIVSASNGTFLGEIGSQPVVYKPQAGEVPLWDFPDGTLANREIAAYELSDLLGWNLVPHTWWGSGPFGPGMLQDWQEPESEHPVDLVPAGQAPPHMLPVFEGVGAQGEPVELVHQDSQILRQIALFDLLVNNADRKGGHLLPMADGHCYAIDHGLTFHAQPKLRTVLWGWRGEAFTDAELAALTGLERYWDDVLARLAPLLSTAETTALSERCHQLLAMRHFPSPHVGAPAIPWPPF
ncbi:MAG: SCO1664 family protein [Beutenbergiaceae bacterium]